MKSKNTPARWYNHWMTHTFLFMLIWCIVLTQPDSAGLPVAIGLFALWCGFAGYAMVSRMNRRG